jgi:dTMP kinase
MLIAVEGIDGCGKTTLVARLAGALRDRGHTVLVVRRYMLDEITALWWRLVGADLVDQRATAQLAAADYAVGLQRIVVPALDAGNVVIADKYAYSHHVYFTLRGFERAELDALFGAIREPDHVLWPRMDPPAALERLRRTDGKPDLLEAGLDHRLGLSIGAAFARYGLGGAPAELRERHFLEHHARTDELFAALLPVARTHELDATLDRDALAAAALDVVLAARPPSERRGARTEVRR